MLWPAATDFEMSETPTAPAAEPPSRRSRVVLLFCTGLLLGVVAALVILVGVFSCEGPAQDAAGYLFLAALLYGVGYAIVRALRRRARISSSPIGCLVWWISLATVVLGLLSLGTRHIMLRTEIVKAKDDVRRLAEAVTLYRSHVGSLPPNLRAVTLSAINRQGHAAGPFIEAIPRAPNPCSWPSTRRPWSEYRYAAGADGGFNVITTGPAGVVCSRGYPCSP